MGFARHAGNTAETFDHRPNSFIICGNNYRLDPSRGGGSAIHVLDYGTAGKIGERFSREARRLISGGDDGDDLWRLRRPFERISERNRGHDE
jgi:hypothetical protein